MASHKFECIVKRKFAHCNILLVLTACCIVYSALVIWPKIIRVVEHSTLHRVADRDQNEFTYTRNSRVIFIGGVPRSGTTLMRALLDAHPDIRCGEETHIIPEILAVHSRWMNNRILKGRLLEAGINMEVLDEAVAAFLLEIMAKHGEPAKRICNKDPFTLLSLSYLHSVFQNGKFLLMIRDGRAVAHSIISRRVNIGGYNISDYRDCLTRWNKQIQIMYNQCLFQGPTVCLPVYYEQIVLQTERWMQHILDFLDVPWNDAVLHHEKAVGKPGGISLSNQERSTDQVVKPINLEALTKWVGHIPADILADVDSIAPMLSELGYDPDALFPNYTQTSQQLGTVYRNRKLLEVDVELNAYDAEDMWEEIHTTNLKKLQQEQFQGQGMVSRKVPISNAHFQY